MIGHTRTERIGAAASRPAVTLYLNQGLCRFEAYEGGVVAAFVRYEMRGGQICFTHTHLCRDVSTVFFAEAFISAVLIEVRRRRLEVLPYCPLTRDFISTHHGYLPLVPAGRRRQFGLDDSISDERSDDGSGRHRQGRARAVHALGWDGPPAGKCAGYARDLLRLRC